MGLWIPQTTTVSKWTDKAGRVSVWHAHNYIQAGFLTSGEVVFHLEANKVLKVCRGDFFSVAPRQKHDMITSGDSDATCIDLRFKLMPVGKEKVKSLEAVGGKHLEYLMNNSFMVMRPDSEQIREILDRMLASNSEPVGVRSFLLNLQLLELAKSLSEASRHNEHARHDVPVEHHAVTWVMGEIRRRYQEDLDISSLAEEANVSIWHLSRLFRQYTGRTPKRYLIEYRIDVAKELLLREDTKLIKTIAVNAGFRDLHQFSRAFRRYVGCAPSDFIRG